jgi:hypothetical protein
MLFTIILAIVFVIYRDKKFHFISETDNEDAQATFYETHCLYSKYNDCELRYSSEGIKGSNTQVVDKFDIICDGFSVFASRENAKLVTLMDEGEYTELNSVECFSIVSGNEKSKSKIFKVTGGVR